MWDLLSPDSSQRYQGAWSASESAKTADRRGGTAVAWAASMPTSSAYEDAARLLSSAASPRRCSHVSTIAPHTPPSARERCLACEARIRSEYDEMPGLSLTPAQAARLWQVEREMAASVLSNLTLEGFLRETSAHRFVRA
jgi:hypothetical protein